MQVWKWNGASNDFTTLLPVRDEDLLSGVFSADGTLKTWAKPPEVRPGIEKHAKDQRPLGDLSFVMGGSVVLNAKAYAALGEFLGAFGQFLQMDLLDGTRMAGGKQPLYFYNVTNVITCIDFARSHTEGKKVIEPFFVPGSVPAGAQVFKDPLRKKADIYLNEPAHVQLTALIEGAGLLGSTMSLVSR
jgi:hypothetical protein